MSKPDIRLPETVEECFALKVWADAQDDRPAPASPLQITKHLTFMAATLPSKSTDDESGKMRVAVYSKILGAYSNEALAYMARRACSEMQWFPTPRQCLELVRQYQPPVSEKVEALALCHRFWEGKFDDFIFELEQGIAQQEMIDAAPLNWRKIAMERGFLRWVPEGDRYMIRHKLVGATA
ncbi:hypothetical protein [Sphingobium chungbukense]|nr:hypothetical protein [Sphingobium chungbukense]